MMKLTCLKLNLALIKNAIERNSNDNLKSNENVFQSGAQSNTFQVGFARNTSSSMLKANPKTRQASRVFFNSNHDRMNVSLSSDNSHKHIRTQSCDKPTKCEKVISNYDVHIPFMTINSTGPWHKEGPLSHSIMKPAKPEDIEKSAIENCSLNKAYRENMYSTHFKERCIDEFDSVKSIDIGACTKDYNNIQNGSEIGNDKDVRSSQSTLNPNCQSEISTDISYIRK